VLVPLDWLKPARRQPEALPEDFREDFQVLSRLANVLDDALLMATGKADLREIRAVVELDALIRRRVDFPAPDRPMMPTIWPDGTFSVASATATRSPNLRVTLSSCSMASSISPETG
jgi:hypothetical protein